jgi:hypothetical protein
MNYIDGIVDMPYDTAESDAEQSAERQKNLSYLYAVCMESETAYQNPVPLCMAFGVSLSDLQKYSGARA